jgi:hypothetical protein
MMKCSRNTSKFQIAKNMHFNITGPVKAVNIIDVKTAQLKTIKHCFSASICNTAEVVIQL